MTGGAVREVVSRERVSLKFAGLDGGRGELTWGQRFVWDIMRSLAPAHHYLNLAFRLHLPTDATRERVLAALHVLVGHYDTLRTRFPAGPDGEPRQQCDPAGELVVEICETGPGDVRRLAEQDEKRLWRRPFQHQGEWPLRVSVIAADGRPRQVVFVFSHLAVDAWGYAVLRREFLDLLRAGRTPPPHAEAEHAEPEREPERAEPERAGWQPRARAAFEASAAGRKANELSLAYWRRVLETAPQTAFPTQPEAGETPLFPGVGIHSVALAAAAKALGERHHVGPAAVLLATLSTIIGIRTGTEIVPVYLATGNRFTSADTASVGTFYQAAPAVVRLDAGSLAGTIRNAHAASTLAYLRGQSDPREVARLLDAANARRGVAIELQTTMNVVPELGITGTLPTIRDTAELRKMTASTRISQLDGRDSERLKLYMHVKSIHSRADIEIFCDSRYLSASSARKLLAGLELVLIEMLDAGDLSMERVADLVGIAPLTRSPKCVVVDNCRIDMDAVRGLVHDLPGMLASNVFVVRPDEGRSRLVAYTVPAEPTTPERLHTALLSRLDGRLTMTPQWYVVCRGAPARPQARAEWERQEVLLQGSGRVGGEPADAGSTQIIDAYWGT